ncbi:MAG: hypothetical protein ACI8YQ_001205 [Polaribacter sp.]|jgi:hypothetical protein
MSYVYSEYNRTMRNLHFLRKRTKGKEALDQRTGLQEDFLHLCISKTHQKQNNLAH